MRALPIQVGGVWRSYGRTLESPAEKPVEIANEGTTEGAIKAWETKHRGANFMRTPAWTMKQKPLSVMPHADPDEKGPPDITDSDLQDASGDADYESGRAKIYTEGSHHMATRAHEDAAEAHRYAAGLHHEAGSYEKAKRHETQASHHEAEAGRTYPWLEKHLDAKHKARMEGLKEQVANGAPAGNRNAAGPHKHIETQKYHEDAFTSESHGVPKEGLKIEGIGTIHRFGVWKKDERGRPQVVETGPDLEALRRKHNVDPKRHAPIGA